MTMPWIAINLIIGILIAMLFTMAIIFFTWRMNEMSEEAYEREYETNRELWKRNGSYLCKEISKGNNSVFTGAECYEEKDSDETEGERPS